MLYLLLSAEGCMGRKGTQWQWVVAAASGAKACPPAGAVLFSVVPKGGGVYDFPLHLGGRYLPFILSIFNESYLFASK